MENIKKENCDECEKQSLGQKLLNWLRANFVAVIVTGLIVPFLFWLFPSPWNPKAPFTATIKVYGWEGYDHNPLNGKGAIILELDEPKKAGITEEGIATFKNIPSKYNGKMVAIHITNTENEPYYLTDSTIKIQKDSTINVQVLLRGLEKLEGQILDETGINGLQGVNILVAGQDTITDEWGHFSIKIPQDKLKRIQLVEVKKDGYEPASPYFDMTGSFEIKLKKQK